MINTDTIAAPITPLVTSPVITLRISGSNALKVYSLMEKGGKSINVSNIKPNYVSLILKLPILLPAKMWWKYHFTEILCLLMLHFLQSIL